MVRIFSEHKKERIEMGIKEYGKDKWNEWSDSKLIVEAQEELVDCANYLDQLRKRKPEVDNFEGMLKVIYGNLEKIKDGLSDAKK